MTMNDREAVIHGSMDRLVGQVRSWRASWPAAGPNSNSELCSAHKDDIYCFFRDSGLQPWEFHTMLHRASEYGLVDDMKGLWQEVATTFLQLRSTHATDLAQQNRPAAAGSAAGQGQHNKSNGNIGPYVGAWPANGRSSSSGGSSGYPKPPGLDASDQSGAATPPGMRQQQQYGVPPPPPGSGARSPADDTSAAASDQQSGRKQQQQAGKKASKQQPQQQAKGPAAGGNAASVQQQRTGAAAANSKSTGSDVLTNGYIPAWRNNIAAAGVGQAAPAFAGLPGQQQRQVNALAGFPGSSNGVDQQQRGAGAAAGLQGQGQGGTTTAAAPPAGASSGGWEVQEPLDLLPSGLLDDVYDQGDAVVEAPPAYTATANGTSSGSSAHRAGGNAAQAGLGAGKGGKQQQGKRQQKQQQQSQQQSQAGAAAASSEEQGAFQQQGQQQQQQQQAVSQAGQQQQQSMLRPLNLDAAFSGPLIPAAGYGALELSSPLGMMQHQQRLAFDGLAAQSQQQQLLMLQQQARMYQQQFAGLGTWAAAGHMGGTYSHAFGAMPAPPPPPPPRGATSSAQPPAAASAAAPGAGAPSRAPTAAPQQQQQQPAKQGYAAVAAAAAAAAPAAQRSAAAGAPAARAVGGPRQPAAAAASDPGNGQSTPASLYQPVQSSTQQQQQQQLLHESSQQQLSAPAAAQQQQQQLAGLSLFQTASFDSPVTPPLAAGPLSPYPSPLHRSLSASAGASPALQAVGTAAAGSGSSSNALQGFGSNSAMAPMLLPPSAASLGVIGEPVYGSSAGSSGTFAAHMGAHQQQQQQHDMLLGGAAATGDEPVQPWSFGGAGAVGTGPVGPAAHTQQQQQHMTDDSCASMGVLAADSSSCSAASSVTAATAASVATTPHSQADSPAGSSDSGAIGTPAAAPAATLTAADAARQPPPPPPRTSSGDQQQAVAGSSATSSPQQQQQQPPAPPPKPMTWAQKLLTAKQNSAAAAPAGPAAAAATEAAAHAGGQPRIAPAPKSELLQQQAGAAAAAAAAAGTGRSAQRAGSTGQALLAAARQQEAAAEAAAATAVPTYSETAALDGLDAVTAKAAVSAASRMPTPSKLINAWRSGLCLASLIKLLQAQRPDLATAVNDRIKGWLTQDCDRSTAECLVLFVLVNLRRDWHAAAKSPGAFLMALLQHRAALIGGSGMGRKLLETARNFPNVAVYIDSDVLQELGDMEPALRCFIMDEYMCKQRHDWPEGLKFPSQCLLSCMRSIRYADPAVHKAYASLMESRPDLAKAMNGVILYGLCKCDAGTGLAAVKRLSELPEEWTAAARVNASAFLYQKVQELCGSHGY